MVQMGSMAIACFKDVSTPLSLVWDDEFVVALDEGRMQFRFFCCVV
jgi:hypothetical protein